VTAIVDPSQPAPPAETRMGALWPPFE